MSLNFTKSFGDLKSRGKSESESDVPHRSVPASPMVETNPIFRRTKSTSRSFRSHFRTTQHSNHAANGRTAAATRRSLQSDSVVSSPTSPVMKSSVTPSPSNESFSGLKIFSAFSKYR